MSECYVPSRVLEMRRLIAEALAALDKQKAKAA